MSFLSGISNLINQGEQTVSGLWNQGVSTINNAISSGITTVEDGVQQLATLINNAIQEGKIAASDAETLIMGVLSGKIPLSQIGVQGLNLILQDVGQPILDIFSSGMEKSFPQLLLGGQLYSWDTVRSPHGDADIIGAREDPRTAVGYMAAASIANPIRFAAVIGGATGLDRYPPSMFGSEATYQMDEIRYGLYGQDTVTVQSGDTLSGIADSNGVSLSDLEAANPQISNPDLIYPGQKVTIPHNSASTSGDGQSPNPSIPAVPDGGGGTDPGSNNPPPPNTSSQPSGIMGLVSSAIALISKFASSIMKLFGLGQGSPIPSGAGAQPPPAGGSAGTTSTPSTSTPSDDNSTLIVLVIGGVILYFAFSGDEKKKGEKKEHDKPTFAQ